jgi:hypothetical protein
LYYDLSLQVRYNNILKRIRELGQRAEHLQVQAQEILKRQAAETEAYRKVEYLLLKCFRLIGLGAEELRVQTEALLNCVPVS